MAEEVKTEVTATNMPADPTSSQSDQTSNIESPTFETFSLPGGEKIRVHKEDLPIAMQSRDKMVSGYNEMQSKLQSGEAERQRAAQEAEKAAREKEQLELIKNGKLSELRKSVGQEFEQQITQYQEQVGKLQQAVVRNAIHGAIAKVENVNPKAIDDIAALVELQQPKFENEEVKVGEASLIEFVSSLVAERPHFQVVQSTVGTGRAQPQSKTPRVEITRAQYNENPMKASKMLASGEAILKD